MRNKYRYWNDAIRKYLLENAQSNDEVFLYITSEVLDKISGLYPDRNLGGHEGFEDCVKSMFSNEDRKRSTRLYDLWKDLFGSIPAENYRKYINSKNFFECALCFTDREINKKFKCGYLNVLAFALLKLHSCPEDNEYAIGRFLTNTIKNELKGNEHGDYSPISRMFAHLSKQYPAFKDVSINGYPYVGRLRYQLILTPSQISSLRKLLYSRCITTAASDSYESTLNKIHGYASVDIKVLLEKSLSYAPYKTRVQNIFTNFNLESYAATLQSDPLPPINGILRHALCFEETPRPILLSDICNVNILCQDSNGDTLSLSAEPHDRLGGLNPNHVIRNGKDRVEIDEAISVSNSHLHLFTKNSNGIWLFEENYNHNYYIETDDPLPGRNVYVVADANCKERLKSLVDISQLTMLYDPTKCIDSQEITDIIGKNRYLYECPGSAFKISKSGVLSLADTKRNRLNKIDKKGGILHPGHCNEYLANVLPEYSFPDSINVKGIKLKISISEKPFSDFNLIYSDENGIIINIHDFSRFDTQKATRIDLDFDLGGNEHFKDILYVIKADGTFKKEKLLRLDKWGQATMDESVKDYFARGAQSGSALPADGRLMTFSSSMYNLKSIQDFSTDGLIDLSSYYLINLLAAVGHADSNMTISRSRLKDCILMAAVRNSVAESEENPEETDKYIKATISKLKILGYVMPIYGEGQLRYQVLPPMFVKTHAPVSTNKGGDPYIWMLMGCYTRGFLEALIYEHKDLIMTPNQRCSDLVGNRLMLHHTFKPKNFVYDHIVVDYDLVSSILSGMPTVDDFITTLTAIPQFGVSLMPAEKQKFPRVRESDGPVYRKTRYLEKACGCFFESPVSDPGWLFLAEAQMTELSNILLGGASLLRPAYILFPSILERVLGMMNVNPPKRIRTFVKDSDDPLHALFCDYYEYGLDTGNVASGQLRRIFGEPGKLYSDFLFVRDTFITLYTKTDHFCAGPTYALVYSILKGNFDLVAYWFGSHKDPIVFIAGDGGCYVQVDLSAYECKTVGINKIISKLIESRKNFQDIPVMANSQVKTLRYQLDKYAKTDLIVVKKLKTK